MDLLCQKKDMPVFEGPIQGYVVNFLKKSLWRVRATHTFEDAQQEAYAVFLRTAAKYPDTETPEHFMSLFMRSWINEFHDLSSKATEARKLVSDIKPSFDGEEGERYDPVGDLDNDGALAVMLRQAPQEVLMVLNLFLNAPAELLELASNTWRKHGHYNADGDKAVSAMLGLPKGSTPMRATEEYLKN